MSKQLVTVILTLVFLAGCWGPEFTSGAEFDDDPPESTSTTGTVSAGGAGGSSSATASTATTGGSGGSGGSDGGSSSTITTTGAAGADGGDDASTETSTTGSPDPGCKHPVPDLGKPRPWLSYEESHSRLCAGGAATGTVACAGGYPCAMFNLRSQIEPWSENGLVFKVTYVPAGAQHFEMLVDCGSEVTQCEYALEITSEEVYFLELEESEAGFTVKAFYAEGDEPMKESVTMHHSARPVDPGAEGCDGVTNPNVFIEDFWAEYVEWVRGLTWECVPE